MDSWTELALGHVSQEHESSVQCHVAALVRDMHVSRSAAWAVVTAVKSLGLVGYGEDW